MNDLTGERNVVLGCLAGGMTRAEVAERYDDIVEFSGVNDNGDFISLPMRTYSSGMSARLRFSIAAAKSHDVLLVDEALSTGDAEFRRRSEARIRELRQEAGAVFLVSHSLGVVRDPASARSGSTVDASSPTERPGPSSTPTTPATIRRCSSNGWRPRRAFDRICRMSRTRYALADRLVWPYADGPLSVHFPDL
jgi:hypothetical protein